MPTDYRRFTGPEESYNPYDFCTDVKGKRESPTLDKIRPDGRQPNHLRPMYIKSGVVSQARGSAYIEMEQTKVICSVYGPRETSRKEDFSLKGQLTCDFKFMTFSCQHRRQHQQDEQEKDLSARLLEAMGPSVCLHKYPKSQINIYVMVLQNDGSALAAAIVCTTVAMATAGVEMYDLVLASSVAVRGKHVLTDPTVQEEEAVLHGTEKEEMLAGTMTVSLLPSIGQVSAVSSDGCLLPDAVKQNMQLCIGNCQKIYPIVRRCLVTHLMETRTHES